MLSSNTSQAADGGYQISRSLRFNSADNAYLIRTPASAGNRKTWTWSAWVKRSELGVRQQLFNARPGSSEVIEFFDETLSVFEYTGASIYNIRTNQVFRDPSAWYHIVVFKDTTQATDTNRMKVYVNGVQITSLMTASYPTLNSESYINSTVDHHIGCTLPTALHFGGYMAEMHFIDGQALTPSSFGETNAQTGVWQPKAYSGSYGTNGFYLNFSDNSNTTAATLGKDYSGNGNNWTPNNFSVAAGAGNDSLVDTPTPYGSDTGAGGEVRGNYCTFNPLKIDTNLSLANGNLDLTRANSSGWKNAEATVGVQSGKWYFEITPTGANLPANFMLGVGDPAQIAVDAYLGGTSRVWGYQGNGNYYNNGTTYGSKPTISANDVVMVAYDLDSGKLWFGKNGSWNGGGSPASGTSADFTNLTGTISAAAGWFAAGTAHINFGQRPFAYTAPSGFKALCTQNLPTPAIGATTATQAGKFFNPVLYTGTQTTQSVTGVGFQPDFTWIKDRTTAWTNVLTDAVRGAGKSLYSNSTDPEVTNDSNGYLSAFNSDGFTLAGGLRVNASGDAIVAWNWAANGAGSTNTAGSITSTVSANTTSGFSIVTFTGTGSNATVGHGLGTAPSMIITKVRNQTGDWVVYSSAIGSDKYLLLNTTTSQITNTSTWQNTAPTSSVFYIGSGAFPNGWTQVAYCFAEVPGFSRFGSYVGNGSNDGPFVYCGFKPRFLITKASSGGTSDWAIVDTARSTFNVIDKELFANLSNAESSGFAWVDALSNGFKCRQTYSALNVSGVTYIFMAFAESPFKYSLAN